MRLRRSADDVQAREGAVIPVEVLQELATAWYGDRYDPDWEPRTVEESQAILDRLGLTDPFWSLRA